MGENDSDMNTISACVPQPGGAVAGYKTFSGLAMLHFGTFSLCSSSQKYVQFLMAELAIHHNGTTRTKCVEKFSPCV